MSLQALPMLKASSSVVQFTDAHGNPISSIGCGIPYSFNVLGYNQIHLTLTKDGTVVYDQPFSVPMPAYSANCDKDPGHYLAVASEIGTGEEIGRTTFDITGGGVGSGFFDNIPTEYLYIGGAVLLLLMIKPKRQSS